MGNTNSGRGGLPREIRRHVERLIRDGRLKNAQIARECGIDVSTVSRYKRRMRDEDRAAAAGQEITEHGTESERCGSCGGRVLMSVGYCVRCHLTKTVFEPARQLRIAKYHGRRSQKARIAA
jgi:Winged helix-turn-helix DNA-binding